MARTFPDGFFWGTATAAHQVEGNNFNNWCVWEKEKSRIADGKPSGLACDHYARFERDFTGLAAMANNAHRFSLEWSRLEPRPGAWNEEAFGHYRKVLEALRQQGMEPFVTLHHFTNPVWFESMGGFLHPDSLFYFERFVEKVVEKLGDLVRFCITINEPVVYTYQGYVLGIWPPGEKNLGAAGKVLRNLLHAHALAYRAIHDGNENAAVGIAKHVRVFDPARPASPFDRGAAKLYHHIFNSSVMNAFQTGRLAWPVGDNSCVPGLKGSQDFIGINYYTRGMVRFRLSRPGSLFAEQKFREDSPKNSLGWEIYPDGLYRTIVEMKRFGLPIYITENGTTVDDDKVRVRYLRDHLVRVAQGLDAGADVRGYFYWSSMDNFEWAEGYKARFGLIDVDFATQARTPRPSAEYFAACAKANAVAALDGFPAT